MGGRADASDTHGLPWAIAHGDCRLALLAYDGETFDSCVTDPPYELGFMGKAWDASGVAFDPETWRQVFRVLKPGAHLLAFGGTRTYHRMASAIEDVGFEIRDCITWHYGSGFPKSHNLDGAHDGWGTALKPAHEPIVLARKPFRGTVAQNVARWGTGAINVEETRIGTTKRVPGSPKRADASEHTVSMPGYDGGSGHDPNIGRWPPNVLLTHSADCVRVGDKAVKASNAPGMDRGSALGRMNDDAWQAKERKPQSYGTDGTETVPAYDCAPDCPVALMDRQSGDAGGTGGTRRTGGGGYEGGWGAERAPADVTDSGGASRFFPTFEWSAEDDAPFMYCAKAATAEREAGLSHRRRQKFVQGYAANADSSPDRDGDIGLNRVKMRANIHPTVKPIALMRWLCRLVTPKGGLVLEPFAGSGTTIVAALREGMRARGVELDAKHIELARERIAEDSPLFNRTGTL